MDDGTTEAHLLAGLGVGMQRVVVAIEAVYMCGLHGRLNSTGCVGRAVGRWVARDLGAW